MLAVIVYRGLNKFISPLTSIIPLPLICRKCDRPSNNGKGRQLNLLSASPNYHGSHYTLCLTVETGHFFFGDIEVGVNLLDVVVVFKSVDQS